MHYYILFHKISILPSQVSWLEHLLSSGNSCLTLYAMYATMFKMESTRTSTGKNYIAKLYILLQNFVFLFQIIYQKESFLTTPHIENKFRNSTEFH